MPKLEWMDRSANLWRDRARELQLRIRDRFRVAVVRQHRRWEAQSGDCSAFARRWLDRLQALLNDPSLAATSGSRSLSSSLKFYRKKVGKDAMSDDSIVARMLQALAVPILGTACHAFMHGLNNVQIYGAEKLHQALLQRPQGIPLLTVSNHVASIDDPLVIASLLPPSVIANAKKLRWTLCASDRCFTNPAFSAFFRCVKVLPVSRGEGIYQKGMDMALSKINNGGWVHIFPEGSRSRDGGRTMSNAKRGVGRLVIDADTIPIVVPFVHTGMQEIMPIGSRFPKVGKTVTVLIGDPIFLDDLLVNKDNPEFISNGSLYDEVSSRIGHRLQELKVRVDQLASEHVSSNQEYLHKEHGCGIWQQVDWEAFGMGDYMPGEQIQTVKPLSNKQQGQHHFDNACEPSPQRTISLSFSYGSGIISRVRGYMDPSELMGFAARGLFNKGQLFEETRQSIQDMSPFKTWKQFLEGNVPQWNRG